MCVCVKGGYPDNPGASPADPRGLSRNDCAVLDNFPHALCFAFRTDNTGPPKNVAVCYARWLFITIITRDIVITVANAITKANMLLPKMKSGWLYEC